MGKKHPYYGKSMSISFPDFHHTMGFVAFSRTEGNLWGNPCISHMMTSVNFFLCKGVLDKNRCNCLQYIPDLAEKSICCRENPEAANVARCSVKEGMQRPAQVFSCEYCIIFINTYFEKLL